MQSHKAKLISLSTKNKVTLHDNKLFITNRSTCVLQFGSNIYFAPGQVQSTAISMCVCLPVCLHVSITTRPNFTTGYWLRFYVPLNTK